MARERIELSIPKALVSKTSMYPCSTTAPKFMVARGFEPRNPKAAAFETAMYAIPSDDRNGAESNRTTSNRLKACRAAFTPRLHRAYFGGEAATRTLKPHRATHQHCAGLPVSLPLRGGTTGSRNPVTGLTSRLPSIDRPSRLIWRAVEDSNPALWIRNPPLYSAELTAPIGPTGFKPISPASEAGALFC